MTDPRIKTLAKNLIGFSCAVKPGEKILIVNEIYHVPPGMTGDKEAFDFDAANIENLAVMQQYLFVVDRDLRQLVQAIDHLAAHFAGQIAVLNLADVELCVPE